MYFTNGSPTPHRAGDAFYDHEVALDFAAITRPDVNTRGGAFGPGGYGGGLFDGSNMGFGSIPGLGVFPPPSEYPNGYPSPEYRVESGDTGTTISRRITGDGNRWNELVAANPSRRDATYGLRIYPGNMLVLPPSWVATGSGGAGPAPVTAPRPGGAALPAGIAPEEWMSAVQGFQYILNDVLDEMGYGGVGYDGQVTPALCGAVQFVASQIAAGARPGSGSALAGAINETFGGMRFGSILETVCAGAQPWSAPVRTGGAPAPGPAPAPPRPAPPAPVPEPGAADDWDACYVEVGDSGPVITQIQRNLNAVLGEAGYEPVPETGVWDLATCGGFFALKGEPDFMDWVPEVAECPAGFVLPLDCPGAPRPRKIGGKKMSKAAMWAIGGLLAAGLVGGLYAASKAR